MFPIKWIHPPLAVKVSEKFSSSYPHIFSFSHMKKIDFIDSFAASVSVLSGVSSFALLVL
jgi:hypothetical protein